MDFIPKKHMVNKILLSLTFNFTFWTSKVAEFKQRRNSPRINQFNLKTVKDDVITWYYSVVVHTIIWKKRIEKSHLKDCF
jgi:hypothetical protein